MAVLIPGFSEERQTDNPASVALRAGTLNFSSVLMQGVTHIAPAVGLILTIQYITSLAGIAAPLAFAIAFAIILTLGISLTQLAKTFSSAGGYYNYISETVHPKAGFLAGWVYFLYDPANAAVNLAFMGYFLQTTLLVEFGIDLKWWVFFIPAALIISLLAYRGIEISSKAIVWLTGTEIAIVLALAFSSVLRPFDTLNFHSFTPSQIPAGGGLYLGVIFSIFNFTGFESVAPLAEESKNPERNLPRSIICSILIAGGFFVFSSWAVLVGWGTGHVHSLVASQENPVLVLAKRLWGPAWILLFVAVANSVFGVSIAGTNSSTRVFFAMSRAGTLPRVLSRIHKQYQTPSAAIWLQTAITLVVGLGIGFWIGPDQEFYFMGTAMTLSLIFVYVAGNYGVFRYFYRCPGEFRIWLHFLFPMISTVALLFVGYQSVVSTTAGPLRFAPFVALVWLLLGGILMMLVKQQINDEPSEP